VTLVLLIAGAGLSSLQAQSIFGTIVGVVVTAEGGVTLPYSVVAIPALGRERFTTVAGSFVLAEIPAGSVVLIARRLGYVPKEMTVTVRAGVTDTLRVELARVAIELAAMHVRAYPECKHPGPPHPGTDSVLATVFTQLRMNANQYQLLVQSYPFEYAVVSQLGRITKDSGAIVDQTDTVRIGGDPGWRYNPGKVVTRSTSRGAKGAFFFHLPLLVDFADELFIRNHCFHSGGLTSDDTALFRIDLIAASRIRTPDVNGSIYLDTATYQIRRSVLHLSPLPKVRGLVEMEVTTDFAELLPSIPVISRVSSRETFDPNVLGLVDPGTFEEQRLVAFRFLGRKPGEERKP
jgi:hypothetical protein